MRLPRRPNGFTLIEMLIVMVIIGILATLVVTNLMTAQQRARDAKRRGDIKALQNAFEQYYAENGSYETDCATMATNDYIPQGVPADPSTRLEYTEPTSCVADSTSYCLCAQLERDGGNATALPSSTSCAYATSQGLTVYCLSNLQ